MTQRISLLWRRFSPLEEQLLAAVRPVLPARAQATFDAQVAGITRVQRHPLWVEICFYRRRRGSSKVDWSDIPAFPHTGEFPLAEVRFVVEQRRFKARLSSIKGHIFDFAITPSPKAVAFAKWDAAPDVRLLSDPLSVESGRTPEPIPAAWGEFLARRRSLPASDWTFHNGETAYRLTVDEGEFLILAERAGDEFILCRLDPPASTFFYLRSHDGTPEAMEGTIEEGFSKIFRSPK